MEKLAMPYKSEFTEVMIVDDEKRVFIVKDELTEYKVDFKEKNCDCGGFEDYSPSMGTPAKQAHINRKKARCEHANLVAEVRQHMNTSCPNSDCDGMLYYLTERPPLVTRRCVECNENY